MRYFTHHWSREQYDVDLAEMEESGSTSVIDNSAGSGFLAAAVAPGDVLYVINWHMGVLSVLGRFVVGGVLDRAQARAELGADFDAPELAFAEDGKVTYEVFDAALNGPETGDDDDLLDLVEFVAEDGSLSTPAKGADGGVDADSFDGVREITADTASLLDELLGFDLDQEIGPDDSVARRLVSTDYYIGDDDVASVDVLCEAGELLGRWRDADLEPVDQDVLDDPELLADVLWAEIQRSAAEGDVRILSERADIVAQLRDDLGDRDRDLDLDLD